MNKKYIVELTVEEIESLEGMLRRGTERVRRMKRAQVLLAAHRGEQDEVIAQTLGVGTSTVYRTKRRLVEEGLSAALSEQPRPGRGRKLSGEEEALLVAVACSSPPRGRARWTLELLADAIVHRTEHDSLSGETVRRRLHEQRLKPWRQKMWCIPSVNAEYVARMEDVLSLYTAPADDTQPVVCFDETPVQLIGETRVPVAACPGQLARFDYEYRRAGSANLFVFLDAHQPWRHVKVTARRTSLDFAQCMHDLVFEHYPDATKIHVVLDNLSTHKAAALYEAFPPPVAREVLSRLVFHYVPKHASWLNMVEIEIGVLSKQCLSRRLSTMDILRQEIEAWESQRNHDKARIRWLFGIEQARQKLGRSYPKLTHDLPLESAA